MIDNLNRLDITTFTDMIDSSEYYQVDVVDNKFTMQSNLALDWLERRCTVIVLDKNSDRKMMLTPFDLNTGTSDNVFKRSYQGGKYANITMDFVPEDLPSTEISKWLIQLSKRFHYSWMNKLKDYLITEEFRNINKLANVTARKDKTIFPVKEDVYRMFSYDILKTKVVFLGQDAYPSSHANGIAFATDQISKPISLRQLEKAIQKDLSLPINWQIQNNLENVVKQGVFLGNAGLTVEFNNPGSYTELWKPFIKEVIKVLDALPNPMIFVLLGKTAQGFEQYLTKGKHSVYKIEHPAAASYQNREWNYEGVFKQINSILEDMKVPIIKW